MRAWSPILLMLVAGLSLSLVRTSACGDPGPTPTPVPTPLPTPLPTPTPQPIPPGHGAACSSSTQCASGEYCWGIPNIGEAATGCCTSGGSVPGQGAFCESTSQCQAGLECIVESCSPSWMVGDFSRAPNARIPDGDPAGLVDAVLVSCLATVAVDVTVDVYIEHPRISDLVVTMQDVSMDITTVLFNQDFGGTVLELKNVPVRHSGDEYVNGYWPLTVKDVVSGQEGTLVRWSLHVTSRWD